MTPRRWVKEHRDDPYVRRAKAAGYRSRAAWKLTEIAEREGLFRAGQRVVDLGAAPGGWSQVAACRVGPQGRVVALDLLPMEPLPGVCVVQGDFNDTGVRAHLRDALGGEADLILSDMAPNLGGIGAVDAARCLSLAEAVLSVAPQWLAAGGALLLKVFEGAEIHSVRRRMARDFSSVRVRKPAASRARSSEVYLVARGFGL